MKKRVLIFAVDYFPYVGGAEVAVREITKRIPQVDFSLITGRNSLSLSSFELIDSLMVFRVGIGIRLVDRYFFPITAFFKACTLHKKAPFDAVSALMANASGVAGLAFKLLHPTVPFILSVQEGDSDVEHRKWTWFWRPLYRRIYESADRIHTISAHLARRVYGIRPDAPVTVISNGVDTDLFSGSCNRDFCGTWTIVTVSRLVGKNAIRDLIDAMDLLPSSARLVIIGDGFLRPSLERRALALGLSDRVEFKGSLPHAEIARIFSTAHAFVRPSASEGFGNAFLEAMASGVPVVGTPVGGIPDFLEDGVTGLFCIVHDPASIASCLRLLMSDEPLRKRLAEQGQCLARERYGWDDIAERHAALLGIA